MDVARHLSAHSHPLSVLMDAVYKLLEKAEEPRMPHAEMGGNSWVASICREEVLREIVGADAEEIRLCTELVEQERQRWHFHHHADLDVRLKGNPILREMLLRVPDGCLELDEFFYRRNHGRHDLHTTCCGGPKNGAQLCLQ